MGFDQYDHKEAVPLPVLKHIKQAEPIFSVLEIRTPEEKLPDPALFGHVIWPNGNRDVYLLSRWVKDSDMNFLPTIDDVRRIIKAREYGGILPKVVGFLVLAACTAIGAYLGYLNPPRPGTEVFAMFFIGLLGGVMGTLLGFISFFIFDAITESLHRKQFKAQYPHLAALI